MGNHRDLIDGLLKSEIFRIGNFTLKSGVSSPVYIDLRRVIHYPSVIGDLAAAIRNKQIEANIEAEVLCGVPYTALPIASVCSVNYNIPMVMKRKEAKSYGTKQMVEGVFEKGIKCLIIEDIVSSGSSVIETADALRKEGLIVTDCIVVIDRRQGAELNLSNQGIKLHSLLSINDIFVEYCSVKQVSQELIHSVENYLKNNSYIPIKKTQLYMTKSFKERADNSVQPITKRIFEIIDQKKSNLCVAVDTCYFQQLLTLAKLLGPHICMLKTHVDIIKDFNYSLINELTAIAKEFDFLLFEDRKFADIGSTVKYQYKEGLYSILEWADIVTVHGIAGNGVLDALKSAAAGKAKACVLIAEMSSKGNLIDENYTKKIIEMGENNPDFVIGYICQQGLTQNESYVHMCPGVGIHDVSDSLGQQYKSPEQAIFNGADIIIVGRGICLSSDVVKSAIEYKTKGYNSYLARISK